MKQLAIKAENISKQYRLGEVGTGTLSHDLNRFWHKVRGKEDPYLRIGEANNRAVKGDSDYVWSLRDINFEIEQGDAVGIIGRNGAGKSTLLKLLSKVTKPTAGSFKVNGRIASLLEVGTGFNPEMTGRENIYLNGAILGMRRHEITRKLDEIIDFSGVERYIDTPVKRYSSGMYVRLAFAVAAHLESEILIVDEVLAVGDAEFQKKCLGKMGDVSKGEGRTVLFVSHNIAAVKTLCNTGILLENGILRTSGQIEGVTEQYRVSNIKCSEDYSVSKNSEIYVKRAKVISDFAEFYSHDNISFSIEVENSISNLENVYALVRIMDSNEQPLFSSQQIINKSNDRFLMTIENGFLVKGSYYLSIYIYRPGSYPFDIVERCCDFVILNNNKEFAHLETFNIGRVYNSLKWEVN
jgi:lipopolysaccharide transport system ATP-binding protein